MNRTLAALALFTALAAHAAPDLDACVYPSTGVAIEPKLCQHLRSSAAGQPIADDATWRHHRQQAALAAQQAQEQRATAAAAQQAQRAEQLRLAREAAAAENARRAAEHQAAEDARKAADDAAVARWRVQEGERQAAADQAQREREEADRLEEARMDKLRKQCGADFGRPRVGMTLARARQCVADLELYADNGVAKVYRSGRLHVTVRGGTVASWVAF